MLGGFIFAIIWPIYARYQENLRPNVCQSNLKQIALAVFQYSQDYDERYPLVEVHDAPISATRSLGWADALQPYLKSTRVFQCPEEGDEANDKLPNQQGYTDYWYNARLNAMEQKNVPHLISTLMFGDGNDGTDATNARYSLSELPPAWAPTKRHRDGANYSFADGHAKWLTPDAITNQKPNGKNATFLVK